MFWRSVVGKLVITILLLVSFVLFILTVLLLQFFEDFHIQEAEKNMMQSASEIGLLLEDHDDKASIMEITEAIKDKSTKAIIYFKNGDMWESKTSNDKLTHLDELLPSENSDLEKVISAKKEIKDSVLLSENQTEIIYVAAPIENEEAGVVIYQTLDVVNQTRAETTKLILVAAGIAIILTIFFAFFLSTRITAPLIQMREAALGLTKGEFNKEVPILTNDEIGELALAFNQMGKQLDFHITALRQEKEQLSSILSSMADGVITLNRKGDIVVINPPAQQFLDKWHFELDSDDKLPERILYLLEKVISEESETIEEISVQGRNYVLLVTPLYDQNYIRGAVAVIRDMTEERKSDKLRKDFVANVSHELRTPLSLMQGYSEAIIDDVAETKEDKNELAKIIHDEAMRMSSLVNEQLDLARIEAGNVQLNVDPIKIYPFIERVTQKFQNVSEERNITIEVTGKVEAEIAHIDLDQMDQVITNLLDNAIRHMDDGGNINICVNNDVEQLEIEVSDRKSVV